MPSPSFSAGLSPSLRGCPFLPAFCRCRCGPSPFQISRSCLYRPSHLPLFPVADPGPQPIRRRLSGLHRLANSPSAAFRSCSDRPTYGSHIHQGIHPPDLALGGRLGPQQCGLHPCSPERLGWELGHRNVPLQPTRSRTWEGPRHREPRSPRSTVYRTLPGPNGGGPDPPPIPPPKQPTPRPRPNASSEQDQIRGVNASAATLGTVPRVRTRRSPRRWGGLNTPWGLCPQTPRASEARHRVRHHRGEPHQPDSWVDPHKIVPRISVDTRNHL